MSAAKNWMTVTAMSALGIGLLATSSVGVANAMSLVDSSTAAEVPPISSVPGDSKGSADSGDVSVSIPPGSADPDLAPTPPPVIDEPLAPGPQPVAPRPASSANASPQSPVSSN